MFLVRETLIQMKTALQRRCLIPRTGHRCSSCTSLILPHYPSFQPTPKTSTAVNTKGKGTFKCGEKGTIPQVSVLMLGLNMVISSKVML